MFWESAKKAGVVEVVCGSMFSGKTEELIRRLKRAQFANQKIQVFKPCIDVRYSETEVVSHNAHALAAQPVATSQELETKINPDTQVVGLDEAQFFDMGIVDVAQNLADRGVRVIAAGLDMDFTGKPFGPMPSLMAIAEDVQKVHAVCVKCGELASYSHRMSSSDDLVVLGEKDIYEPLCRRCYNAALKK